MTMDRPISKQDSLELLESAYREIQRLELPRHSGVDGRPKEKGGLTINAKIKYRLDSYTAYKTPAGDAVSLGILQDANGEPFVAVHRRQPRDGKLTTVASDEFRIEDLSAAAAFFVATAVMISRHPHTWHEKHPSDLQKVVDGER